MHLRASAERRRLWAAEGQTALSTQAPLDQGKELRQRVRHGRFGTRWPRRDGDETLSGLSLSR